jgi:hypothetical protein
MKKDDLTVGGGEVIDNRNYADESLIKIDVYPTKKHKRSETNEDLKKTNKSGTLLNSLGKAVSSQMI